MFKKHFAKRLEIQYQSIYYICYLYTVTIILFAKTFNPIDELRCFSYINSSMTKMINMKYKYNY